MIFLMTGLRLSLLILRLLVVPDGISLQHGIILRSRDRLRNRFRQVLPSFTRMWQCLIQVQEVLLQHLQRTDRGMFWLHGKMKHFSHYRNIRASMRLSFRPHLYCASQRLRRLTRSHRWMEQKGWQTPIFLSCTPMTHRGLRHRISTDL